VIFAALDAAKIALELGAALCSRWLRGDLEFQRLPHGPMWPLVIQRSMPTCT